MKKHTKIITLGCIALGLTVIGCTHVGSTGNTTDANREIHGNYDLMRESIGALSPEEHAQWETFYSESGELDWNSAYYSEQTHAYEDGYRSGYAYFKTTQIEFHRSMMREMGPQEDAYVQGWYGGQLRAITELISDALKPVASPSQ